MDRKKAYLFEKQIEPILKFADNRLINGDFNEFNILVKEDAQDVLVAANDDGPWSHVQTTGLLNAMVDASLRRRSRPKDQVDDHDTQKEGAGDEECDRGETSGDVEAYQTLASSMRLDSIGEL
ncbi:hypothetical protein FN846DRAFT_907480 [Sphaerosporella brunnea]|uniref:Uncharacterized protein n=1 Tax=Sphaerosporella brunnea TaxID=1250544 RepID=A0A5J5EVL0_9PEZI|nr:hypothetical protein FN846DRAFT_907480 [Sphaerosporella brunnea]